jgi:hypothetical protein
MLAKEWLDDHTSATQARLAAASDAIASNLQEAHRAIARHGVAGLDYARAVGGGMRKESYRLGRSARGLVGERPIESIVIIGAAAFAIGWLWHRSRQLRAQEAASARAPVKRRKSPVT